MTLRLCWLAVVAGLAPGACGSGQMAPLARAASRNAADTVRMLVAEGGDPDALDATGLTPLVCAARTGALDAMRVLLDAGADPSIRDRRNGWTALLHAVHRRQTDAVRLLLAGGADPNQPAGMTTRCSWPRPMRIRPSRSCCCPLAPTRRAAAPAARRL